MSLHGLPFRWTVKKCEDSRSMEAFLFPPLKFAIQTWFFNFPQCLYLFHIVFEYIPGIHDQGKMSVRINVLFLSSQYYVMHIHR